MFDMLFLNHNLLIIQNVKFYQKVGQGVINKVKRYKAYQNKL